MVTTNIFLKTTPNAKRLLKYPEIKKFLIIIHNPVFKAIKLEVMF